MRYNSDVSTLIRHKDIGTMPRKSIRSGDQRTKLTVSITPDDKRLLKVAAAERDTTVADLVHQWIEQEFRSEKVKR